MIAGVMLAAAVASAPIDYAITVAPGGEAPVVTVALTFTGDADGETTVELPSEWAGSSQLYAALSAPEVTGGTLVPAAAPTEWRIAHAPGATVTIRYRVADARPGRPDAGYEKARPEVNRDWFQLHGEGAIAIPEGRNDAPARFRWGAVLAGWRVAADVEQAAGLTANGVGGGIFVGGRGLSVTTRLIDGAPLRIAMVAPPPGGAAAFGDRLERLVRTENRMMGARAIPYLVTAIPLTGAETGALSYGGSGRTAGFALSMTGNVTIDQLSRLLAHEYAHRWFGEGLGRIPDGAGPYWLTEGVNDWFAARAMVASGLWTPADWVRALNEKLLGYGNSRARDLSDGEVTAQFWTNPDAMQVQYDRGQLMALVLDRRLGGGLAGPLRTMVQTRSDEDATERFVRLVDARAPGAVAAARAAVAEPLPAGLLAACGRIATLSRPRYDRGFDSDDQRVVTAVYGAAVAAGIRPGWRYVRRISFEFNDATVPWVAEFDTGAGIKRLSWLPQGEQMVEVQRLDGSGAATPACRALVAGSAATP